MLKKITAITLLSALTFATAHAKSAPTAQEQKIFTGCSLLSYLSYQAMTNYQNGLSQNQNNTQLHQQFAQTFNQTFGQGSSDKLIGRTLQVVYEQPKGNTNQEKEDLSKIFALGTLQGCADETGLDLNKFN